MNLENNSNIIRSFLIGSEKCPVCGATALTYLHLYQAPHNETVAIVTIKCDKCGFKYSSVLSIATPFSDNKCIEIEVSDPQDLRTLIYISDNTTIEIPDIDIKVDLSQLRLGSIVTVDAILSYLVEWIENAQYVENDDKFTKTLLLLKSLLDGYIDRKVKIIIRSDNGVGIVNSYRKNYSRC